MNSKFSGKSIANSSKLAASGKNFISKTARLLKKADADFGETILNPELEEPTETDISNLAPYERPEEPVSPASSFPKNNIIYRSPNLPDKYLTHYTEYNKQREAYVDSLVELGIYDEFNKENKNFDAYVSQIKFSLTPMGGALSPRATGILKNFIVSGGASWDSLMELINLNDDLLYTLVENAEYFKKTKTRPSHHNLNKNFASKLQAMVMSAKKIKSMDAKAVELADKKFQDRIKKLTSEDSEEPVTKKMVQKPHALKPNETIREIQKLLDMPKQNGLWDADATQGYWRHFIDENYNGKFKNVIRENWAAGAASLGYEKTPEGMLNFMKNIELGQVAQPRPAGSLPEPVTTAGLNKKFISKKAQMAQIAPENLRMKEDRKMNEVSLPSSSSVSERLYSQIDSALRNFEGGPKYDMRQDLGQPSTSNFVEKDSVVRISPNLPQQLIPDSLRDGVLNQKGELARCLKEKGNYRTFNELSNLLDAGFISASEKLKINGVLSPRVPSLLKGFMVKDDLNQLLAFIKANDSLRVKYLPKSSVNDFTLDAGMMSILKEMRSKAIRLGQMLSECSESLAKRTYDDTSIPEAKSLSAKPHQAKPSVLKPNSLLTQFQERIGASQPFESTWGPRTERAWKNFVGRYIHDEDFKKNLFSMPWSNPSDPTNSGSKYVSAHVNKRYAPDLSGILLFANDLVTTGIAEYIFDGDPKGKIFREKGGFSLRPAGDTRIASRKVNFISKRAQSSIIDNLFLSNVLKLSDSVKPKFLQASESVQDLKSKIVEINKLYHLIDRRGTPSFLNTIIFPYLQGSLTTEEAIQAGEEMGVLGTESSDPSEIKIYKENLLKNFQNMKQLLSVFANTAAKLILPQQSAQQDLKSQPKPSDAKPSVAKKSSHEKLHKIQKALGVTPSNTWDDATKTAWEKLIDAKYSVGLDGNTPISQEDKASMKASWKESAAKVNQQATQDGILAFIEELKGDKYIAKTPEAAKPETKPAEQAEAQPAAGEPAKSGYTLEQLKNDIIALSRNASPIVFEGEELLSSGKVMRRTNDYIQRLGGAASAADRLAREPGLLYFEKLMGNPDQLRGVIYSELQRLAMPGFRGKMRERALERRKSRAERRKKNP